MVQSRLKIVCALMFVLLLGACFRAAPPLEDDEPEFATETISSDPAAPTPTPVDAPNAPNNSPLIMQLSNLTIDELTTYPAMSFRIFDFDDEVMCKSVVPVSDNLSAIMTTTTATQNQTSMTYGDITITGGDTTRCGIAITTRYATLNPVKITLFLSDQTGTSKSYFSVQVTSTNGAPKIAAAGQDSIGVNEDQSPGQNILLPQFTDDTPRGSPAQMSFQIVSHPLKGTLGNWPSDPGAGGVSVSYLPVANENGQDTFSYKVCDNDPGIVRCSDVQTIAVSISAQNDAPSLDPISTQNTTEAVPVLVNFIARDVDGPLQCNSTYLSYSSSDPVLVPNSGAVSFGGSWPNCTATISPALNKSGFSNLTLTLSDGSLIGSQSFQLNVSGVNHAPTMGAISAQSVTEDTPFQVNFTVDDQDGTYICNSTYLSYSSGTTSKIASSGAVAWSGTWPNCTATVSPMANQTGSVNLTFTVTDVGGLSASRTFATTLDNVNDIPFGALACEGSSSANVIRAGKSGSWNISCNGVTDVDGDTLSYIMDFDSSSHLSGVTCASNLTASYVAVPVPSKYNFSGNYAFSPNYGTCRYKIKACDPSGACTPMTSYYAEITHFQLAISPVTKPTLSDSCVLSSSATFSFSGNISNLNYSALTNMSGTTAQTGATVTSPFIFSNIASPSYLIATPPVKDSSQTSASASFQFTGGSFLAGISGNSNISTTATQSSSYLVNRVLEQIKLRTLSDYSNTISENSVNLDGYQPGYETTSNVCRQCTTGNLASLSAAKNHSCLIDVSTLKCWGNNANSKLGNGNTTQYTFPQSITISSFTPLQVAAGSDFTCALGTVSSNKEIRCAGNNSFGQLGRSTGATNTYSTAINFSGRTPVAVSVSKFGQFGCSILNDSGAGTAGHVHCWGGNTSGQLGNGSTTTPTPTGSVATVSSGAFVGANKNIFALGIGYEHACAIQNQSSSVNAVYCWGNGSEGKLGNNSSGNSTTPVAVESSQLGTNVLQVVAGYSHTCALRSGGDVYCWGDNSLGQLGVGSTTSSQAPAQVTGLPSPAVQLTVGSNHTCALLNDYSVYCWGLGTAGQLGVGSVIASDESDDCNPASGAVNVTFCKKTPASITFPSTATVVSISAGEFHTCAMSIEGTSYCWGDNSSGQLGTSSNQQVSTPAYICSNSSRCANTPTLTTPRPKMCSKYVIP